MTAPAATHHLAQVNIALPVAPLGSPALAGFVAALDEATRSPTRRRASSGGCRPRTATPPRSAPSVTTG
jgi:hypothetical protein